MRIRSESMIAVSLSMFLMASASVLTLPKVAADDYIDSASVSIPASCSMTGTGLVHEAEVNNGQTVNDIGLTNIKVFCNDRLGFAIYAIGYTDDTYGKTVLSNSTLGSSFDIETSATIVDATSSWAMKLAAVSGTYTPIIVGSSADTEQGDPDFSNYAAVPEEYTKVAYYGSTTDSGASATGSNLTVTYRAHVSRFQPAGTYVGQVKYTIVHPKMAAAPSLYCNPDGTTITTIGCMQDLNVNNKASVLASMTEDTDYTLRDSRDGKTYAVAKLRDGNIWMVQNLDLDIDSNKTYTSGDTDLPNGVTWTPMRSTYADDDDTWIEDDYSPESYDAGDLYMNITFFVMNYVQGCQRGVCDQFSYNLLPNDWQTFLDSCSDITDLSTCDQSLMPEFDPEATTVSSGIPRTFLGNYYNYSAAVAMNDTSGFNINDGATRAGQSICPAGWHLPSDDWTYEDGISWWDLSTSGSFGYLVKQYDWADPGDYLSGYAASLFMSYGRYYNGALNDVGIIGVFLDDGIMNYQNEEGVGILFFSDDDGIAPFGLLRSYGGSVRCVAR